MISVVPCSLSTTVTTTIGKAFFITTPASRGFFGTERSFDLSVHPQEEPFLDGPRLALWRDGRLRDG
jgi:hypothetical protein